MTRRPRKRVVAQTRARLSGLHFNRLIPNILTVLALCAGLTAILYGYQGNWKFAVLAVAIAAVLDALDGRVARLLGGSTKFGAESFSPKSSARLRDLSSKYNRSRPQMSQIGADGYWMD